MAVSIKILGDEASLEAALARMRSSLQLTEDQIAGKAKLVVEKSAIERQNLEGLAVAYQALADGAEKGSAVQIAAASEAEKALKKLGTTAEQEAQATISRATAQKARLEDLVGVYTRIAAAAEKGSATQVVAAEQAEAALQKLGLTEEQVAEKAKAAGVAAAAGMKATAGTLAAAGASAESVGKTLTTKLTIPIALAAAGAGKLGIDFQSNMRMIQTQAGASAKDVDELTKSVLDLGKSTPQGPDELAQALYHLKSLGGPMNDNAKAMQALAVASKGAMIGQANLEDTTSALGAAIRTGIKGTSDYAGTMGTLNAIIGAGNMRMEDLIGALGTGVLPAAKMGGVSITQFGAALATMTDEGVPADQAATRLRMTFSLLGGPSKQAQKILDAMGLSSNALGKAMQGPGGLTSALTLLKQHLDQVGQGLSASKQKAEQFEVLSRAFGGGRSAAGIMMLINNLGVYDQKLGQITGTASRFNQDVLAAQATDLNKVKTAWSQIQVAAIEASSAILPPVAHIAQDVGGLADDFSGLSNNTKKWLLISAGIAAVSGPVVRLTGLVTKMGSSVIGLGATWKANYARMAVEAEAAGATTEASMGGIRIAAIATAATIEGALVATGIGALIVAAGLAATYVITHWTQVKNFVAQLGHFLVGTFQASWTAVKGATNLAVYGMLMEFDLLIKGIEKATGWIPGIGGKIKSALHDVDSFVEQFRTNGVADMQKAGSQMGAAWSSSFESSMKSGLAAATAAAAAAGQPISEHGGGQGAASGGGSRAYAVSAGVDMKDENAMIPIALQALGKAGYSVDVTSGYRTYAQQAALYARYVKSGFNIKYIAAKPGTSNHETGNAVDVYVNGKPVDQSPGALALLKKYGLVADVAGDHEHLDYLSATAPKVTGGTTPNEAAIAAALNGSGSSSAAKAAASLHASLKKLDQTASADAKKISDDLKQHLLSPDVAKELQARVKTIETEISKAGGKDALPGLRTQLTNLNQTISTQLQMQSAKTQLAKSSAEISSDLKNKLISPAAAAALRKQAKAISEEIGSGTKDALPKIHSDIAALHAAVTLQLNLGKEQAALNVQAKQLDALITAGIVTPAAVASLRAKAKSIGVAIANGTKDSLPTIRQSISDLKAQVSEWTAQATDVTKWNADITAMTTDVGNQLQQALGLPELYAPPDVLQSARQGAAKIMTELKTQLLTPAVRKALEQQLATDKTTIQSGLNGLLQSLQLSQSKFETAWGRIASAQDNAFDKVTQKNLDDMQTALDTALKNMQVTVQTAYGSFQFGGSITQTPAQQELAQLQAAHDAQQLADQLAADQAQQASDQAQLGTDQGAGADASTLASDQAAVVADAKQVAEDLYDQKVAALQAQADLESTAAQSQLQTAQDNYTKQQQAAMDAYSDQRDLLKTAMDDQVQLIVTGMENGTIATADGFAELKKVYADNGVPLGNAAFVLAGQIYSGLADGGLQDAIDLIQQLQDAIADLREEVGDPVDYSTNPTADPAWQAAVSAANAAPEDPSDVVSRLLGRSGIPGFASGVNDFAGGWAITGEEGRELVHLPAGSSVIPHQETERILRGGRARAAATAATSSAVGSSTTDAGVGDVHVHFHGGTFIGAKPKQVARDLAPHIRSELLLTGKKTSTRNALT